MAECNPEICSMKFKSIEKENEALRAEMKEIIADMKDLKEKVDDIKLIKKDIEVMKASIEIMSADLKQLLEQPSKRWETMIGAFIVGVIGVVVGYIFKK